MAQRKPIPFRHRRSGHLLFAVIALALAYGAGSWAIDNGNLLLYLAGIILVIFALSQIVKAIRKPAP